ncbi:uncharacterized protein LOC129800941 [Phlebotomus papatasi]|uniref:uncharacterized protein LOC129800941 n=1 Tax=Phlebotomus papatasi TaxID=29031 RepID=UPI0024845AC5|nr:uncharacterized protein LOC129800941 [Phlebotomus papatasi]
MHEEDQNLQRILHRDDPTKPLQTFLLTTVTYGTASAPYLSTRCMKQLVAEDGDNYPHAKEVANRDFYVDDLLTGTQTIQEAVTLQEELVALFKGGGFSLKKWSSNSQEILDKIPPEDRETKSVLEFDSGGSISTLGLQCNPLSDTLSFKISLKEGAIVKRSVLSNMSRVFDPLGLLSPVTITGKIFIQKLWKENLDWDTELPEQLRDEWISYQEEILKLSALSLPRKFTPFDDVKQLQLYGFCDASQDAYAACIYARSINLNGEVSCQLIAAKTRVAPTSPLTIPRLELCGAILLVRLLKKVQKALSMEIGDIRVFSDSTIVLHWISGEASRWKTFVRNRVIKIQSEIPATSWGHVRSEDNPADLASRGVQSDVLLHNDFWFHGPQWILHDVPPPFIQKIEPKDIPAEDLEEIKVCTHFHVSNPFWNIIDRYSSLTRLVRAVGILRRFTQFITNKYKGPCHVNRGPLTAAELDSARETIIKAVQAQSFAEEIQEISRGKEKKVSRDSSVRKLHPILDDRGLVRVGGRIERAETTFDHKHPILLPYKHHFTDLVAQHFHTTTLHGGPKLLLNAMRMEYWPINGMRVAKRITGRCLNCFKVKPRGVEQLMADCQTNRVRQYRPFTHTGVDYCGPFLLKPLTRKGAPPKVYISVFICLTTRAIHLEVAGSLTLEAFLAAMRRFTARRGIPSHIYCDNATNFVGGSRELDQLKQQFTSEQGQNTLINTTAEMGIKFHFIPPASPTFGGSWESGVKLFKTHFRRVAGNASLTQEQMNTLVTQIEGILNSRPLTDLSTDPRDFSPLTPGHLLILGPPNETPQLNIPEPSLLHIPNNRLGHWQRVQQIVQHFWARWHREYLHSLQPRNKWMKDNPAVEVNDLVLIKQDNLPPLRWPTGRVIKVHPGDDNLVRVVSLQTPLGITQRALSKICPLPKETSMENLKSLIVISPSQDVIAHATTEPRCGK